MLLASSMVIATCCACVMVVEKLVNEDSGCMNLMTFASFLFVAAEGLLFTSRFFTVKNHIPLRSYVNVVVLFFLVNVINNQALNFRIPMPLHIIFRSGSLVSNLLLGKWLLNKQYSWRKYASVFVISVGITLATLATYNSQQGSKGAETAESTFDLRLLIGVLMLLFALIFSSILGIFQEKMYRLYGKHSREAMFYVHCLSLPGFALFYRDIAQHIEVFNRSELVNLLFIGIRLPRLWFLLLLNCLTQYFCIRFVYYLTAHCSTLTVTLVITIRKFISLLISIVLFRNPFTLNHWIGTALVFVGTLLFIDVYPITKPKAVHQKSS
uniref:UDP-xylose and UDP-N-acetylglucosamine transporter n=1 Tax=Trichuris muris TaxID=70415 RepID=A0A5S6R299_TRIMR